MSVYPEIGERYHRVLEQIGRASEKSGRRPDAVRLVVVTKGQPIDKVKAVLDLGARNLGENRVEEVLPKMELLADYADIQWHMIGHVQSRKAKFVLDGFHLIHSLDSWKLAELYNRLAGESGKVLPVLLEMNAGGEESKYGWDISTSGRIGEVSQSVDAIIQLPNLAVRGLMTMPPLTPDLGELRRVFQRVRRLQVDLKAKFPTQDIIELSMGTSADFETAIEEGATLIRVGQGILGERTRISQ